MAGVEPPGALVEPPAALSLGEILRWRAEHQPDRVGYVFLTDGEAAAEPISYAELDAHAAAVAAVLHERGAAGRPVMLAHPAGLEFVAAFFGCLYAGAIPVVVPLPSSGTAAESHVDRFCAVAADVEPAAAVSPGAVLAEMPAEVRRLSPLREAAWIVQEDAEAVLGGGGPVAAPGPDDLAYLQYTSGSTRQPHGVMVGHRALLDQLERYRHRAGPEWRKAVMVGWLPHQHDFGLVGFVLSAVYMGVPYHFMAPADFLRRPLRWPEAIARARGTYSGAPTFAYALCARDRGEPPASDLDLSSWSIASVGAEPIAADVLDRFARRFEPYGFDRSAFLTTYGLAEAVLCVTARRGVVVSEAGPGVASSNGSRPRPRVSAGSPLPGQTVLVVDPETRIERAAGELGEIWVGGCSLASGYWRRPEETEQTFQAVLAETGAGPFLRTGDLGFVRDGDLFVVDRLKDLIVVRGQNHHPCDIESTVQSTSHALRRGYGAAFQDGPEGDERLVVVQELARGATADPAELVAGARAAVAEIHGLHLTALELVAPGSLPRTATGKVRRRAARDAWRAGKLQSVAAAGSGGPRPRAADPAVSEVELASIWHDVLGVPGVGAHDDFRALGGDSLAAYRVVGAVAERFGVELPVRALFEERTPARVAAYLARLARSTAPSEVEPEAGVVPLSPGQREIVQLAALGPDAAAAFHVMTVLELADAPDEPALRRALDEIVARHESLRTVLEPDGLHTRVLPAAVVDLAVAEVAAADVVGWLRRERLRPFDLAGVPPWRVSLLRSGGTARLVLTAHHLVVDGASVRVLVAELAVLYTHERGERRLPVPMQYREYVRLRERRATPEAMAAHERHWLDELGDELPVLELPSDRPRPSAPTFAAANHSVVLEGSVRARVARLAREHGCTPFMALLAGYAALLHRLSGQDDLLLGFAAAGRDVPGSHTVVGSCGTDLPLRSRVRGDATVAEHLAQVREKVLGALEHQDYTLGMALEKLRAPVDARRPLRVTTAFNLQALPADAAPFAFDLELQAGSITRCVLDLEVYAVDTGTEIRLDFTYATAILDGAAVRRVAACYRRLLEGMAADPSRKVHELPLLSVEEERLLVDEWGRGPDHDPGADLVAALFDDQAARSPDAVAVVDEEQALTYASLRERADAVAAALRDADAEPGTIVALLAARGADFAAAMLGILKAGCVLLPLDPRDPDRRLESMLAQSGAELVLAGAGFETAATRALDAGGEPRPRLVRLADALRHDGARADPAAVGPRDPAYVVYTSGSTGAPKGALVAQAGLVNHLRAKIAALGLTAADTVAQTAPQSFDISIWQYLAPLLVGATVRVVADEATHDPVRLLSAADRERVTIFETVPSTLRALLDDDVQRAAGQPRLEALRWLISTGEALSPELCRRWMSHYATVPVLNAYGPAECSDDVTHQVIEWPPAADARRVPIGRPIPGARVYVLDPHGGLAPVGSPGELHVGGVCVGLGYLNDAESTARAFVADPFVAGATLYRTGDSVRWRADGTLEFLGRIDDQEQIQGVRVEPGEIEAVLGRHPAVRECAVAVRRAPAGRKVLVGYVALRDGIEPRGAELRHFLRTRLPQHMVPATITFVDSVPVSANGKVDRKALPEPALDRRHVAPARVDPRTAEEHGVAAIWAGILERRDFGVHDDFFELGGRSLDAVAISAELRRTFEVEFPVYQVYRDPSLAGIARFVAAARQERQFDQARREPAWT